MSRFVFPRPHVPPPLLATAGAPLPDGAELLAVPTADGTLLRVARWRRPDARGTILLLQGRAEFIEKYAEVVGELLGRGFSVVTFDWRGQGGSARALADPHPGHVASFDEFRLDLQAVVRHAVEPLGGRPVTAVAHSMGGCVALIGAGEGWLHVRRLVALAPMVGLSIVKPPGPARAAARLLRGLGLGARYVPGGRSQSISTLPFRGNRLCGDPARYRRNADLALAVGAGAVGSPTVDWLHAAYEAMGKLVRPGFAAGIRTETLVVAAGDDPVCSTPAIAAFARGLPHGRLLVVPGARHEILMESDAIRARFWAAFDAFVADDAAPAERPRALTG